MEEMEKAISNGDLAKLKKLIADGADINQRLSYNSFSAAHLAVRYLQPDILRFLLEEKNMDPDAEDEAGFSPLFDLCSEIREDEDEKKVLECFQILKDVGANLNIESKNSWKMSCIEKAVFDGNISMIKALADADVNLRPDTVKIEGKNGNLIHLAVEKANQYRPKSEERSFKIIKFLISKMGTDSVNEFMNGKYTTLDLAEEKYNEYLVNGEETPDSNFFKNIIYYLEEIGGKRNATKFFNIPLEQMNKEDDDSDQEEIELFKRFASVMSIAEHVLSILIVGKKTGTNSNEEYIRMAAYAYKEIGELIIYLDENFQKGKLSWERFNAIHAQISIKHMLDPKRSVEPSHEKSLSDIRVDVSGFLTRLNVYSRYE